MPRANMPGRRPAREPHAMSHWLVIILALLVLAGWLLGSIYYTLHGGKSA